MFALQPQRLNHIYHSLLRFLSEKIWKYIKKILVVVIRSMLDPSRELHWWSESTRKCTDANRVKFAESSSKNENLINWIPGIMSPPSPSLALTLIPPHPSMEIELLNRGGSLIAKKSRLRIFASTAISSFFFFVTKIQSPENNFALNDVSAHPTRLNTHKYSERGFFGKVFPFFFVSCKSTTEMEVKRTSRQMHMVHTLESFLTPTVSKAGLRCMKTLLNPHSITYIQVEFLVLLILNMLGLTSFHRHLCESIFIWNCFFRVCNVCLWVDDENVNSHTQLNLHG